jgi:hypothetical protein
MNLIARVIRAISQAVQPLIQIRLIVAVLLTFSFTDIVASALDLTSKTRLTLQLNPATGTYALAMGGSSWVFAGTFNGPLADTVASQGRDAVGSYEQTSFSWRNDQTPVTGFIRVYREQSLALFSQTCGAAVELPPPAFPDFKNIPTGLHIFSHALKTFAPPQFNANESSTPW